MVCLSKICNPPVVCAMRKVNIEAFEMKRSALLDQAGKRANAA